MVELNYKREKWLCDFQKEIWNKNSKIVKIVWEKIKQKNESADNNSVSVLYFKVNCFSAINLQKIRITYSHSNCVTQFNKSYIYT